MSTHDPGAAAVRLLADIYYELEMAGRPPGQRVTTTRQVHDQILNDLREAARLWREACDD